MDPNQRLYEVDEDGNWIPYVPHMERQRAPPPMERQSAPPVPPRRSIRPNFGVPPQFYGNPVPYGRSVPPRIVQKEIVNIPLSSTNPFLPEILKMERTSVAMSPDTKVVPVSNEDAKSTESSSTSRRKRELELRNLQLQMEENDAKIRQLQLNRRSTEIQMQLLEDDLEEGEIVSDEELQEERPEADFHQWKRADSTAFDMSTINHAADQALQFVPTPNPQNAIKSLKPNIPDVRTTKEAKEPKQLDVVPSWGYNPFSTPFEPARKPHHEATTPAEECVNSMTTLAAAIVKAVASQNRVSERFIARQSNDSKLPFFSGNPLDWPIFNSQYKRSSLECGFTSSQNMQRLEKSLRGDARKAVQGLMIVPENADLVMEKLEQRFGKPRYIIEALIASNKKVPAPKEENISSLLDFSNAISNLVTTVETMKAKEHLQNPHLLNELVDKLPAHLKLDWGKVACRITTVSLLDLSKFVEEIAEAASAVSTPKFRMKDEPWKVGREKQETFLVSQDGMERKKFPCCFCDSDEHKSFKCPSFHKANVNQRWQMVKVKKACFSCLNPGHQTSKCRRTVPCGVNGCDKKHNNLLHPVSNDIGGPPLLGTVQLETSCQEDDDSASEVNSHVSQLRQLKSVLLRVLPVKLIGPNGTVETHALLDEGSTVSMMSSVVADKLGLEGELDPLVLRWTDAQCQKDDSSRRVTCKISARDGGKIYSLNDVRTIKNLNLPAQFINMKNVKRKWKHLETCTQLMDLENAKPQILIGQDNISLTVAREVVEGPPNAPIATRTRLGWVLHGPTNKFRTQLYCEHSFVCHETDDIIQQLVKESFKLDSIGIQDRSSKPRSREDEQAIKLMEQRTHKVGTHWETALLFRSEPVEFPPSYSMALKRLKQIEYKMLRDEIFKRQYSERVMYYLEKGYARKLSQNEIKKPSGKEWYLPHFGAVHPNKPGKVRLVFDAAAKVDGISLNSQLLTGPDLLTSLQRGAH